MVEAFERLAFSRFVGAILDNFGELVMNEDGHLFFTLSALWHRHRASLASAVKKCQ